MSRKCPFCGSESVEFEIDWDKFEVFVNSIEYSRDVCQSCGKIVRDFGKIRSKGEILFE